MCRGARIPPERAAQGARAVRPSGPSWRPRTPRGVRVPPLPTCSARFDMSSTLTAVSLRVHPVRAPRARRGARPDAPARSGAAPSPTRAPPRPRRVRRRETRATRIRTSGPPPKRRPTPRPRRRPRPPPRTRMRPTCPSPHPPRRILCAPPSSSAPCSAASRCAATTLPRALRAPPVGPLPALRGPIPGDRNQRGFPHRVRGLVRDLRRPPRPRRRPGRRALRRVRPRRRASVPHRRLQRLGALGTRRRG